jgi:hypothetical protein
VHDRGNRWLTIKEIKPIQYLKTLEGNYAHQYLFNDGKEYVVKFQRVRKYRKREVVNEWLAGNLARLLELPALTTNIVYMPDDSLADIPVHRNSSYKAGTHLAIPFLSHAKSYMELREPIEKSGLDNHEHLAGMLLFDQWINNNDRSRTNILFEEKVEGKYFFWMIDHGRCFPGTYEWNAETLEQEPVYRLDMPVYKWACSLLDRTDPLFKYCEKIMNASPDLIWSLLNQIPAEWEVTQEEKEKLLAFLKRERLHELPKLVINANIQHLRSF